VRWLTPAATDMTEADWKFPEGRFLSYVLGPIEPGGPSLYIVLNAAPQPIKFTFPALRPGGRWQPVLNTAAEIKDSEAFAPGHNQSAPARSVLAFAESA
jgi:glycogen operon protein